MSERELNNEKELSSEEKMNKKPKPDNSNADYDTVKRALDILKILKEETDSESDSENAMSLGELREKLKEKEDNGNAKTVSSAVDRVLMAVNPEYYDEDLKNEYKVIFEGYEEDPIRIRTAIRNLKQKKAAYRRKMKKEKPEISDEELKEGMPKLDLELDESDEDNVDQSEKYDALLKRVPPVTNLRYVHDFSFDELDTIINALYFSKTVNEEERDRLIYKLAKLSSKRYQKKWFSENNNRPVIKNIFQGIVNNNDASRTELKKNIALIQSAIDEKVKIQFIMNVYNAERELVPSKIDDSGKTIWSKVTPYHILIYNDKYYMLANCKPYSNVSVWRIDLMSDVKLLEEEGRPKREIKGMSDTWNGQEYMEKHLHMSYDAPTNVRLKVSNEYYTMMVDWFGNNFVKRREFDEKYDVVTVTCSEQAMINWAMQYSDVVEVLGPPSVQNAIEARCKDVLAKLELNRNSKKSK
ncbi:MAG: WYL domain-containing protein [Coprococcus catus]|nr:WYL domain-containing protein [Coprococcus catus]